ncbi:hypothetical protein COHA_008148 [Chlorella ohadii]|uniref:RWP-RK domain-containing protein n=1 Tax=Chlorella ohadii TaxID=2649997 RepID=A0AAD5DLX8_9CHLO|nr:hypothetical protein COHA_008148 [Chlorella ohadii]
MGPAARETALPPSRLYAIGSQPVIDLPSATYRALGSGAGGRAAPSDWDAGWGSSFGSSRPIGLARGFEHVALPSAPHGLLGNLLQPTAGSMRSQGMHGGCAALPLSLHGSGLPAGAHNNLLQLSEPPAGDLAEEERRMAQIDESAAGARLRFEAFCRPLDSLAQPCCSSGGGVGAAPALQLSDAATARQQSWPAPHKVGQSGHLVEVQQPDERQPVQHAQQGQQQQHSQQPPQRPSSPLAQPSCAANGSGRACPQPPHSPHAGQEGCSLRACGADEEAAAGEAQPNQGRQPARKRKYEASQLTLQIFEEEGCFDMDQNKAATHLGFGSATMIKKQMKKLGLQDWPYRKRSTRKTMVENAELFIEAKAALHCKPDMQAKAAVLLAYVRQLYATAVANPLGLCSTNCPGRNKNGLTQDEERFRQALYKLRDEAHKIEGEGQRG